MLSATKPQVATPHALWASHPILTAFQPSLQITADCWGLLAAPHGSSRKEHYLPKGEREPETGYRKRLDAARPSGFFRDALRTYAGMLSRGSWISLPASLSSVLTDVDGWGTDLGVFLAAADLLVLRDGAALVLVLPPEHSWHSEGDRQEALRRGDRLPPPWVASPAATAPAAPAAMSPSNPWFTTEELCVQLAISRSTLFAIKRSGLLKPGRHLVPKNPGCRRSHLLWHLHRCELALGRQP